MKFDPAQQYGNYLLTHGDPAIFLRMAEEDARTVLPKGTPFEVWPLADFPMRINGGIEYVSLVCWKYTPALTKVKLMPGGRRVVA